MKKSLTIYYKQLYCNITKFNNHNGWITQLYCHITKFNDHNSKYKIQNSGHEYKYITTANVFQKIT